jgi:hypothetical protein
MKNTIQKCGILMMSLFALGTAVLAAEDSAPKALYLKYHEALFVAKDIDALKPYLSQTAIAKIKASPESDRPMMFGLMQTMTPHKLHIDSEKIDGSKATLLVSEQNTEGGMTEKTTGTIQLVREGDAWKIEKEAYDSKSANTPAATPTPSP